MPHKERSSVFEDSIKDGNNKNASSSASDCREPGINYAGTYDNESRRGESVLDGYGEFTFRIPGTRTSTSSTTTGLETYNAWDSPRVIGRSDSESSFIIENTQTRAEQDKYEPCTEQRSTHSNVLHQTGYSNDYHHYLGKHAPKRRYQQSNFQTPKVPDPAANSLENSSGYILAKEDEMESNAEPFSAILEQGPLTWSTDNNGSIRALPGTSTWLTETALAQYGLGHEWNSSISGNGELARRWSQRRSTMNSVVDGDDEFNRYNPHWDDMITFRQTRISAPRERAWSGSEASFASTGDIISQHKVRTLVSMTTSAVGRNFCLTIIPVIVVLLWCSVPLATDTVETVDGPKEKLNFWFFLFFYYGVYNAVALALVTQIFHSYSLTWWPRSMSGFMANVISWVISTGIGACVYLANTGLEKIPPLWTALTLFTLLLPVFISFVNIQRHHRKSTTARRRISTEEQPLVANASEWRTPSSYRRFLWFCSTFFLWYIALAAGEYLAYIYIETLPHNTADGFYYVYSWIVTVNVLSWTTSWVVGAKIRSWPLQYIYTLYFFMTYFIFYRNLFARLQNPEQVIYLQLGSSFWVVFIYPVRMARWVYRILAFVFRWGDDYPYETYVKQLGRTFFLRNKAENATMLGFLFWVTILHFGPNRYHYPYFQFEGKDDEFNYKYDLTVHASILVWASELMASRVVRFLFRWIYKQNISEEAVYDFRRYPHIVPVMVLVTIHVLQNILFGLIHLDFS